MKNFKKIIALFLALTLCLGSGISALAYSDDTTMAQADALNTLGLFQGSDKGYELDRAPSRLEALIMLIRLSGKENEALYSWEPLTSPFTDVPTWEGAAEYIAYAYNNGLTDGVTDTTFDPDSPATAQTFVTFALRALGYTDETVWDNWETLGRDAGIITADTDLANFKRGDAVLVSYAALSAKLAGSDTTLNDWMLDNGIYGELAYNVARSIVGYPVTAESSIMEIYGKLYAGLENGISLSRLMATPFDAESASYFIGASDLDIVEGYACEPMMSSVAHSVCLVRLAEGSDIEAAKTAIRENVNPNKWICVGVDPANIRVENIGNLILLVMDNNNCQQIADAFLSLAQ
ncbi:MAG: S-layer homology domain-containing protein [Clostridiales bacterium]|nr:S-layer homology domain-containing protein [Clostridiales bacterium]